MRLLSVNIARVQEVLYNDKIVRTGIFKKPVADRVRLGTLGLEGDEQADQTHHGGTHMAVYAYSAQGYEHWRRTLAQPDLPYGKIGENLTIEGLTDESVHIGDTFRIGREAGSAGVADRGGEIGHGAIVQVTMPRGPCSKLAMTMNSKEFVKTFLDSLRLGWYMRVLQEGQIGAGDPIVKISEDPTRLSIVEIARLKYFDQTNRAGAAEAASIGALGPTWKELFSTRVRDLDAAGAAEGSAR